MGLVSTRTVQNNEIKFALELYDLREVMYAAIRANDWDRYDIVVKKIREILDR